MSILSSYIRPKLFYRLTVATCSNTSDYLLVERWFLSSSSEYHPGQNPRAPFSDSKLSHPAFHFRLQPFYLALHLQRLSVHIRTSSLRLNLSNQPHWFPNSLRTNNPTLIQHLKPPWKVPASALPALLHLLPYQAVKTNKAGSLNHTGKYISIISVPPRPPPIHILKKIITSKRQSQHLPLSTAQARTFCAYRTDIVGLFNTVHRIKLRPAILSFTWKLLHKTLHLHLHTAHSAIYHLSTHSTSSQHALFSLYCSITHLHSQTSSPLHTPKTKHSLPSLHCGRSGNSSIRKHMKVLYQTTPEARCSSQSHLMGSAE